MPKSIALKEPKRPAAGASLTSEDEAMVLDVAALPLKIKAVLDSHTAVLESTVSKIVCESEERLSERTRADFQAIREHIESLRPVANLAQRFPGIAAPRNCKQEGEVEQEPDPGEATFNGRQVPVLVDRTAGHETRRIVEECVEKLWHVQARSLDKVQSTWTDSLRDMVSDVHCQLHGEMPEQPMTLLTPQVKPLARTSPESNFSRSLMRERRGSRDTPNSAGSNDHALTVESAPQRLSCSSVAEDVRALKSMKGQLDTMRNSYGKYLIDTSRRRETPLEKAKMAVEVASTVVLVANVIWMAVATELNMHYVKRGETAPESFFWVDLSFVIAMCAEVVVKLLLYRMDFFFGPTRRWNVFDVVLILLAGVDLLLSAANLSFIRVLRGLRSVRATRVIRTVAVVPELRLMFASVTASVSSLAWAFVLILLVLFLCAMGVQQTVHSALETRGLANQHPQLMEYYGSLPDSMISLFMAISGGADWKDLAAPLVHISRAYIFAYMLFIILLVFGLLNILTAVFVEKTSDISHADPELVIQGSLTREAESMSQLLAILGEADTDGTGTITREEFEAKLEDPRFRAQMQLLDLHVLEAQGIFQVLDTDRSGDIEIEELVFGLLRMKGNARSMDMNSMLYDQKRLMAKLSTFQHDVESNFKDINSRFKDIQTSLVAQSSSKSSSGPFGFVH